jgi:hypothetical protein
MFLPAPGGTASKLTTPDMDRRGNGGQRHTGCVLEWAGRTDPRPGMKQWPGLRRAGAQRQSPALTPGQRRHAAAAP